MNRLLQATLLSGISLIIAAGYPLTPAWAQEVITPAPDPVVGTAPAAPSGAQGAYDEQAILQLMKLVQLSRLIGGGITEVFTAIKSQTQALSAIRDAQVGTKSFPRNNDADDVTARQGGDGLHEMAVGALRGAAMGPPALLDALRALRTDYELDKAFALRNDSSLSKAMAARASAQGAIAAATAEDSYKRANSSMNRIDGYIAALQTSTDLKTSIDINTRVNIELVQQLNESLRTQAAIASVAGTYFMVIGGEAGKDDYLSGLLKFNR